MKKFIILPLILIFMAIIIYEKKFTIVTIEFLKLRPVKENLNIYYNGYKIGHTLKFRPCKTSKGVCIQAKIRYKDMFIPNNITAKMKQKRIHERKYQDYIDLIYPNEPSYNEISKGTVIKGTLASGLHNYMNEEIGFDELERAKNSLISTAENLESATGVLLELLNSLDETAKTTNKILKSSSNNLSHTSKNIYSVTKKLDDSIDPVTIRKIFEETDGTMSNFNSLSGEAKSFTSRLNSANTVEEMGSLLKNSNDVVGGIKCTLSKPFGGLRIIFGKTVK